MKVRGVLLLLFDLPRQWTRHRFDFLVVNQIRHIRDSAIRISRRVFLDAGSMAYRWTGFVTGVRMFELRGRSESEEKGDHLASLR